MNADERTTAIQDRTTVTGRTSRQWLRGGFEDLPIVRVPVDLLLLNAGNRRFKAELLEWEEQLGRPLDPQASANDERSIVSILLDDNQRISDDMITGKPSKDALALIADWEHRGQEQPLWIRPDGFVVNGNRRLAALKRLGTERGTATGTYSFVDVIVLAHEEVNDDEMFQMEAREQLTEGLKVRYGDLNVLLTLREAAERRCVDWADDASIVAVASQIQDLVGNNASYAATQLRAIHAMDLYLDFTGEPGKYQRMIGQVEKFRDIGKNIQVADREFPERGFELLLLSFRAVQAGMPHGDIRELRKLAVEAPDTFGHVAAEVETILDAPSPSLPPAPTELGDDADLDDDEPDDDDSPVQTSPNFPTRDVKRSLDVAIANRKAKNRNDAEASLREAAGRLQQVSRDDLVGLVAEGKASVLEALLQIRDWAALTKDVDA